MRASAAVVTNSDMHAITIDNVKINEDQTSITFKFDSYKHCNHPTDHFVINSITNHFQCPVNNLAKYLSLRPNSSGPLFIFRDASPVTRPHYANAIKLCTSMLGLDQVYYNTHSVRIGRATDLAIAGVDHETIKTTGRWSSSAYLKYIRLDTFTLPNV